MERGRSDIRKSDPIATKISKLCQQQGHVLPLGLVAKIVTMVQIDYGNKLANMSRITEDEMKRFFTEMATSTTPEQTVEHVLRWGRGLIARGVSVERKNQASACREEGRRPDPES